MPTAPLPRFVPATVKEAFNFVPPLQMVGGAASAVAKPLGFASRVRTALRGATDAARQMPSRAWNTATQAVKNPAPYVWGGAKQLVRHAAVPIASYQAGRFYGAEEGAVKAVDDMMEQQRRNPGGTALLGLAHMFGLGDPLLQHVMSQNPPPPAKLNSNWMTSPGSAFGDYAQSLLHGRVHNKVLANLSQRNQANKGLFF